jgi:hypothetical protein
MKDDAKSLESAAERRERGSSSPIREDDGARMLQAAESVLQRVFGELPFPLATRLWDGTLVRFGRGPDWPFTLVFRSPTVFRRLMLRPNTLRFAEAYVNGEVDVEGDIVSAIGLAARIEEVRLGVRDRLAILRELVRMR